MQGAQPKAKGKAKPQAKGKTSPSDGEPKKKQTAASRAALGFDSDDSGEDEDAASKNNK